MSTREIAEQCIRHSVGDEFLHPLLIDAIDSALKRAIADKQATPIPMVLHCPCCGEQHVDQPESERLYHRRLSNAMPAEVRPRWTNPPHKSHLCYSCGTVWRPADVATTGVASIQTRGKADTWPVRRDDTADTQTETESEK